MLSLGPGAALAADELSPLDIKLPAPHPVGTRHDSADTSEIDPVQTNRGSFLAPKGTANLSFGKKVTTSDTNTDAALLSKIIDGDKSYDSESIVSLRKGVQWVQVDLGVSSQISAVILWHAHDSDKVYHKVVVQLSDTPDFSANVQTIFNNDADNAAGQGAGKDREYVESYMGKLIDAKGAKARYVRCYSKGSTESAMNEYTEIEVWGLPAK